MELVVLGLVFWGFYWLLRGVAKLAAKLGAGRYRPYHLLASRHRGRVEPRGGSDPPTVSFGHGSSSVRVGLAPHVPGQPSGPRLRVVARFAEGIPLRMEVTPRARPAAAQLPKGTRVVRHPDAEFHRDYIIQANDHEMAQEVLSSSVCEALGRLRRLAPPAGLVLSVNPERVLVQVDRNLGLQPEALIGAVHEALLVHDALLDGVRRRIRQGIVVLETRAADPADLGPPQCKVCCEPIERHKNRVLCADCKTPHHDDCWEFNGGCSVYGCKGRRPLREG